MVCFSNHRFKHKNPEDPSEVPGGFITDCNKVRFQLPRVGWLAVRNLIPTDFLEGWWFIRLVSTPCHVVSLHKKLDYS